MVLKKMEALLNDALPDHQVVKDMAIVIEEELKLLPKESEPEEIPSADAKIDVVAKAFIITNYDHAFGNHYIVEVAIGGIESQGDGVVAPKYFFASLYYTKDLQLITVDFHEELR